VLPSLLLVAITSIIVIASDAIMPQGLRSGKPSGMQVFRRAE
jgi:hypothetical protein